jgi:hypothetical protein
MPVSEAQKRASKKWMENNKEKQKIYNKKWREDNEEYRIKQIAYTIKCQRRRRLFQQECRRLCEISIE